MQRKVNLLYGIQLPQKEKNTSNYTVVQKKRANFGGL